MFPPACSTCSRGTVRVDVFTIFPEMIEGYCGLALLGRARRAGLLDLRVHDLRSGAQDPHRSVDDAPFGGGAGMVLMPEPVFGAVEAVERAEGLPRPLLLLGPGGRRFDQSVAVELAGVGDRAARSEAGGGFSLLCGRYEGVDQRVADHLVDGELSVGDYVLAGGEAAALVVLEAVTRLLPGALGNESSSGEESFSEGLLEYPQYTRPAVFRGWAVPEVLRSGDHQRVASWRRAQALRRTLEQRPDLVAARGGLRPDEVALLAAWGEVRLLAEHGYHA
jgi:tRNA (guanine37-N1)-methyltransferase